VRNLLILPSCTYLDMSADNILFSLMCSLKNVTYNRISKLSTNLEPALMYSKLDIVLRVGESATSDEDLIKGSW
jgi:hypothetical protein